MAKLVVLSESQKGLAHELKVERTTIGRVEDNTFPIPEASISSHHCEILLKGNEVVVRDLNSTNGTFINGDRVTESVLKPGQTLRLGQIELKLDGPAPAGKKPLDATMVIPQGVKRDEIGKAGGSVAIGEKSGFHKKSNKLNKIFFVGGAVVLLIIIGLIVFALMQQGAPHE